MSDMNFRRSVPSAGEYELTTAGTRSVKTMSDPKGGKMPNNSDNKGTPPSKPSDTAE